MALTATATPRVRADILHQLNMNQTKWLEYLDLKLSGVKSVLIAPVLRQLFVH